MSNIFLDTDAMTVMFYKITLKVTAANETSDK